jgi:hypothetical protein
LVAIAGTPQTPELAARTTVTIADGAVAGAKQPYHLAAELEFAAAARHIAARAAASEEMAFAGLGKVVAELRDREIEVSGCAMLLAAGRPLPPLADILKSHSLIHTAEGEFFRQAFRNANDRLKLPVTGYRERDLEQHAGKVFGAEADVVIERLALLGKSAGPPWTADQKIGALAAKYVRSRESLRATSPVHPVTALLWSPRSLSHHQAHGRRPLQGPAACRVRAGRGLPSARKTP